MNGKTIKPVICLTLLTISTLVSSVNANTPNTQQLLNKALEKQQQTYQQVQDQLDKLSKLERDSRALRSSFNKNENLEESVAFSVTSSYHNWPKVGHHVRTQDYTIELNFTNKEHNQKLQDQFKLWLAQGWFVERSDTMNLTDRNGSKMQIRLVR